MFKHLLPVLCRWLICLLPLLAAVLPAAPAFALQPVRLQLKWKHQYQFAGYYAALEKGYYRDAGLDVQLLEADDSAPEMAVLAGKAEFGVGDANILIQRAQGMPVVVLGVIFQHSPFAFMVRRDSGIESVHDLAGRRVMLQTNATDLFALLRQENVPQERLQIVPHNYSPQALIDGKVDAMSVYATNEPYLLERAKVPYLLLSPREAGVDFYGDNFYTTEAQLLANPERVKAFRHATLQGWKYAMEHQDEIVDLIYDKYTQRKSREALRFEARQMRALIQPDLIEAGYMNVGRWRHMADTYAYLGMMSRDISLDGFLYDPTPKPLPSWLWPAVLASVCLLLLLSAVVLRITYLNRRLKNEVAERQATEDRLRDSEERYRVIYETAPLAFVMWDTQTIVTGWNRQAEEMFGWTREEVIGRSFFEFMVPESDRETVRQVVNDVVNRRLQVHSINWNLTRNGRLIRCEWNNALQIDGEGHITGVIALAADITDKMRTEEVLKSRVTAIEAAAEAVMITNRSGLIDYVNPAFTQISGYEFHEVVGKSPAFLKSGQQDVDFYRNFWRTIRSGRTWRGELVNRRKDGTLYTEFMAVAPVVDDQRGIVGFVAVKHDVSERKKLEDELRRLATTDVLTGAANRRYLLERGEQEFSRAGRAGHALSLLMLDVDHFKAINDNYGHSAGDSALQTLVGICKAMLRDADVIGRLGGEEFVLILPDTVEEGAMEVAERLRRRIKEAMLSTDDGKVFALTISIGVAELLAVDSSIEDTLKRADRALYRAKREGRDRVVCESPGALTTESC